MTANQIAYYNAQEARRHNLASEGIEASKVSESQRHNVVTEGVSYATLGEAQRHNATQEGIDFFRAQSLATLQQAQADKATSEVGIQSTLAGLQQSQLREQHRHNVATESQQSAINTETKRHNEASEGIQFAQAAGTFTGAIGRFIGGVASIFR